MSIKSIMQDRKEMLHGKFWSDALSLVTGCTPISEGCKNCWLAGHAKRFNPELLGEQFARDHFNGQITIQPSRLNLPISAMKPRVYAVWSDLFHELVPDEFVKEAIEVMRDCPNHEFLIITKRPEEKVSVLVDIEPPVNVTILVTMETAEMTSKRLPWMLGLAARNWTVGILAEPLLRPLELYKLTRAEAALIKWVIAGGETGHRARPMSPEALSDVISFSKIHNIPTLFKAWGSAPPSYEAVQAGYNKNEPKGGRVFDGQLYNGLPD